MKKHLNPMAKWLIILGIILVFTGLLINYAPGIFKWIGRLPGDIRVENENSKFFFPITSMIVISIILTVIVNIIRYFNR